LGCGIEFDIVSNMVGKKVII